MEILQLVEIRNLIMKHLIEECQLKIRINELLEFQFIKEKLKHEIIRTIDFSPNIYASVDM